MCIRDRCKTGILNGDDPYVERILEGVNCDAVTFGIYKDVDVSAKNIALFNEKGICLLYTSRCV